MDFTRIKSTLDHSEQPVQYIPGEPAAPMVVLLHQWSGDYTMQEPAWFTEAQSRGWSIILPDFRGPNVRPEACGSKFAQQDVLDAIAWAKTKLVPHSRRTFLAGVSGGGHMSMLMAARFPALWDAVSEWVGISDLRCWYYERMLEGSWQIYSHNIAACAGGVPGTPKVDEELKTRSPLGQLRNAMGVAIDFNAGIHDGHTGSVPIHHTLDAFNEIAAALGVEQISKFEIDELTTCKHLRVPRTSDDVDDPLYDRKIHLRRFAGASRVTIFEGGHEGLAVPAFAWFDRHC